MIAIKQKTYFFFCKKNVTNIYTKNLIHMHVKGKTKLHHNLKKLYDDIMHIPAN